MLEAVEDGGEWLIRRPLVLRNHRDQEMATATEAARELRLHPTTVARLCLQGKIEGAYRQGCHWRIPRPIQLRKDGQDGHAGHKKLPGNSESR